MVWNWLRGLFGRGRSEPEADPADEWDEGMELERIDEIPADDRPEDGELEEPDADAEAVDAEDPADEPDEEFAALEPAPLEDPDDGPEEPDLSWASSFAQSDGPETEADGGEEGPDDGAIDDLYYRTEEVEDSLEDTEMRLDAIQDSQERVVSRVDELNDRVRRLLGVYDRVTDDVNPFTGDGEAEGGFEVFGGDDVEETVSFDDLKADAAVEPADDADVDEPEPEPESDLEPVPEPTPDPRPIDDEETDVPTLRELPDTYATDVVVFEWLADLLESGGPRATLEALSYYVELGWIDEDVRAHLEAALAGPGIEDVDADPSGALTAADHADSYAYVVQLREIGEIRRTVDP